MSDLRHKAIHKAASLPKGDPLRRKLLAAVANVSMNVPVKLEAMGRRVGKMEFEVKVTLGRRTAIQWFTYDRNRGMVFPMGNSGTNANLWQAVRPEIADLLSKWRY